MATEDLISVTMAAGILGTGRSTVLYLIEQGELMAYRLPSSTSESGTGHKYYLRRGEVEGKAQGSWRKRKKRDRPKRGTGASTPAEGEQAPRELTVDDLHEGVVVRRKVDGTTYLLLMRPEDQGRGPGLWRGKVVAGDLAGTIALNSVVMLPQDQKIVSDYELLPGPG